MRSRSGRTSIPAVPLVLLLGGAAGVGYTIDSLSIESLSANVPRSQCDIKGNLSTTGERIYHMPGQRYYDATRISPSRGERWFCSEADARRAGWRRSLV
jgi:hypothetical protein